MEFKDLILLPAYLIIVGIVLMVVRNQVTTRDTRKYFIPAIAVKFVGAATLGLIYQFYYGGGDTFNYFKEIGVINEALFDSPTVWAKLILSDGSYDPDIVEYSGRLYWFRASREFMVIKVGAVLSLISGNSYLLIALNFALLSFSGLWAMFRAWCELYPNYKREIAIAIFFIPSVFFWGSGLMKDTLCMGGIGWMMYGFYNTFIKRRNIILSVFSIIVSSYFIISIKPYIFYAFMPAAILWLFNFYSSLFRSKFVQIFLLIVIGSGAIFLISSVIDLDDIAYESKVQADYIYSVSKMQGGSAYNIGELDGTMAGMFRLFLPAVNVSLFRPYIFEVRNPVMLLSALESAAMLLFTIYVIFKVGLFRALYRILFNPMLSFCIFFSILFAFFVGISSYNFGALVRYKIPLLPFYIIGLYILLKTSHGKSKKMMTQETQPSSPLEENPTN